MAAYLGTFVTGNEKFGGYMAIDDEAPEAFVTDMLYRLEPGEHSFVISGTPEFDGDDVWEFSVCVDDNDVVRVNTYSQGNKLTQAPAYEVIPLTPAQVADLVKGYNEEKTPKRSVGKIVWGSILLGISAYVGGGVILNEFSNGGSGLIPSIILWGGVAAGGVLLLVTGLKKKVRN